MSAYNFDEIRKRRSWTSMKWNRYANPEVLPMWVADMDFPCAREIIEDLKKLLDEEILGYSEVPEEAFQSVIDWYQKTSGWEVKKEQIIFIPCLVVGLNIVCRAIQMMGGGDVATFSPVYYHFFNAPKDQGLNNLPVPMRKKKGSWEMDFEALEKTVTPKTKLLQLCNPQNPLGRVFGQDELEKLGRICEKHNLYVMSDEVHMNLILDSGKKHLPFPKACPKLAERTAVLNSASKTFNIADGKCAYLIVPGEDFRNRIQDALRGIVSRPNAIGIQSMLSAYAKGGAWLEQVIPYLRKNSRYLIERINSMPLLEATQPQEATYLSWIGAENLPDRFISHFEKHGLGFSAGDPFGDPKSFRINFACPFPLLEKALDRLEKAVKAF